MIYVESQNVSKSSDFQVKIININRLLSRIDNLITSQSLNKDQTDKLIHIIEYELNEEYINKENIDLKTKLCSKLDNLKSLLLRNDEPQNEFLNNIELHTIQSLYPTGSSNDVKSEKVDVDDKKIERLERIIQPSNEVKSKKLFNETSSAETIYLLMKDQKELSAKELENEQSTQYSLLEELIELTGLLKDSTIMINKSVVHQNQQLNLIESYASNNEKELEKQKKKLKERSNAMKSSIWTSVYMIIFILVMFVLTYCIIRLFPSKTIGSYCRNV